MKVDLWEKAIKIATENKRLIFRYAKSLGLDPDDARQEFIMWAAEALEKYDPSRGANEHTYIRNAFPNWLANQLRRKKIPLSFVEDPLYLANPDEQSGFLDEMTDLNIAIQRADLTDEEMQAVNVILERENPRSDITRQGQSYWTKKAISKIKRKT